MSQNTPLKKWLRLYIATATARSNPMFGISLHAIFSTLSDTRGEPWNHRLGLFENTRYDAHSTSRRSFESLSLCWMFIPLQGLGNLAHVP
jgi:hypothetical protein